MKNLTLTLTILLLCGFYAQAQNNHSAGFASSSNSNHRQAKTQFEGSQPMPFQAFDMQGNTHFLPEYKGKVVIMAFWAAADETSRAQIKSLNKLKKEFSSNDLAIISLAEEEKQDLISFLKNNKVEYPVIPNARPLGEVGYGGEFGTSRIFVMDKNGVVQKVMIEDSEEEMETYGKLKPMIEDLMKK